MSGHHRDAQTCANLEAGVVGKSHGTGRVERHIPGRSAEASAVLSLVDPDAFANTALLDTIANSLNDTRSVTVGDDQPLVQ